MKTKIPQSTERNRCWLESARAQQKFAETYPATDSNCHMNELQQVEERQVLPQTGNAEPSIEAEALVPWQPVVTLRYA